MPLVSFYIWTQHWDCKEDFRKYDMPDNLIKGDFLLGKTLSPSPPLRFHIRHYSALNDALVNQWNWLVFSKPLQKVIHQKVQNQVQFLDVQFLKSGNPVENHGYRLCNPLVVIPAVDRDRSKLIFSKQRQDIIGIHALVLDESAVGEHTFFRLREFRSTLVIREDLVQAILEGGFSGMTFTPPADYRR